MYMYGHMAMYMTIILCIPMYGHMAMYMAIILFLSVIYIQFEEKIRHVPGHFFAAKLHRGGFLLNNT